MRVQCLDTPDLGEIDVGIEFSEAANRIFYFCPICERFHPTTGLYSGAIETCRNTGVQMKVVDIRESEIL